MCAGLGFLVQIILGNVSFAPEENVSSAVVGWNFYKCHQVKLFDNALQVFYKFDNFPDNFPTAGVVKLSISPFSSRDQLIDSHGQEGTMAERLKRLRGTGRNILSL